MQYSLKKEQNTMAQMNQLKWDLIRLKVNLQC
jgi:hypothetical protein